MDSRADRSDRPNVLVVMVDEWHAFAFGYTGDPNAHTPHIDGLVADGVDFVNAVSGSPVCCPARASFVTGQYPLTHGVYINDVELSPTGVTLGDAFAASGYDTGYIGKWHLYGSPDGKYGRRRSYIPADKRLGFDYWKAAECTHQYNESFYYEGDDPTVQYWEGYDAIAQTDDACRYIEAHQTSDNPWLLVVSFGPPHFPLHTAPEHYRQLYRDADVVLRPNVPAATSEEAAEDLRGYYAHIAALDDCVGSLLATIDRTGGRDDTIVVFLSDHGDMMGSQGIPSMHKLVPWEESIRIPLAVRWPGLLAGGTREAAMFNAPDLLPMLLDLCGLPKPSGLEGSNPLDPNASRRDSAFLCLPVSFINARRRGLGEYRGVRTATHTFVRTRQGPWLLYDNVEDPYQMRNLIAEKPHREVREQLDAELTGWLEELDDQFLAGETYLARDGLTHYAETSVQVGSSRSPWGDWVSTMDPDDRHN